MGRGELGKNVFKEISIIRGLLAKGSLTTTFPMMREKEWDRYILYIYIYIYIYIYNFRSINLLFREGG